MEKIDKVSTGIGIFLVTLMLSIIYGYVVNVIWLIRQELTWTVEQVVSLIGIFIAPLGALMGWLH